MESKNGGPVHTGQGPFIKFNLKEVDAEYDYKEENLALAHAFSECVLPRRNKGN